MVEAQYGNHNMLHSSEVGNRGEELVDGRCSRPHHKAHCTRSQDCISYEYIFLIIVIVAAVVEVLEANFEIWNSWLISISEPFFCVENVTSSFCSTEIYSPTVPFTRFGQTWWSPSADDCHSPQGCCPSRWWFRGFSRPASHSSLDFVGSWSQNSQNHNIPGGGIRSL